MPNLNVGPKPIMNFNNQTPSSNFNRPNNTTSVNQNTPAPLSESEEFVLKSFEGYRDSYFETFSDETKQKQRERAIGRKQSNETIQKKADAIRGMKREKKLCPHCEKLVAVNGYTRWHGDNCRLR